MQADLTQGMTFLIPNKTLTYFIFKLYINILLTKIGHDMRRNLKAINGQRMRFTATVERFGHKTAFQGEPIPTILLKNVRVLETNHRAADHLWFTKGKSWDKCIIGCIVEFDARVTTYEKGYKGHRYDVFDAPVKTDYKLERPTKVEVK